MKVGSKFKHVKSDVPWVQSALRKSFPLNPERLLTTSPGMPNSQIRRSKSEIRNKSEGRNPKHASDAGLRFRGAMRELDRGILTPALLTRSLPLVRSSRACGFAHIPFAASQAAQVSTSQRRGRGTAVALFELCSMIWMFSTVQSSKSAVHSLRPADRLFVSRIRVTFLH